MAPPGQRQHPSHPPRISYALVPGDVTVEVDRAAVTTAADVASKIAVAPKDRPLLLRVRRGETSRWVPLEREG